VSAVFNSGGSSTRTLSQHFHNSRPVHFRTALLFDHLVGAAKQRGWDRDPEVLPKSEVASGLPRKETNSELRLRIKARISITLRWAGESLKGRDAITALAALAQNNRLDVFRLLVQAGPEGMSAGAVADALGLRANTLTFHFDRLQTAGLVSSRRNGRSIVYAARFEAMNALITFLT
jgi:ArsR family transcriptional regulator, arsenate/arsenite/antimonite-responsive transcriptional repressor